MNQEFNFTRVLSAIAASKQIKDPKVWVSSHFDHARITDQGTLLHADAIPYGVKDADWECGQHLSIQPRHFTAYAVTSHPDTGRVVRLLRFSDLSDKAFLDLLHELYYDSPECARELLVYYDLTDIRFRLLDQAGHEIKLGDDSNTLDPADNETVMAHDLYVVRYGKQVSYYTSRELAALYLSTEGNAWGEPDPDHDTPEAEAFHPAFFELYHCLHPVSYRYARSRKDGHVSILFL